MGRDLLPRLATRPLTSGRLSRISSRISARCAATRCGSGRSLELLAETVADELAAQERRGDALDSKAGVLLGFASVLVGLTSTNLHGSLAKLGLGFAAVAAICAVFAFVPRSYPTLKLRPLRRRYFAAEEEFTRLRLLDTRIAWISYSLTRSGTQYAS